MLVFRTMVAHLSTLVPTQFLEGARHATEQAIRAATKKIKGGTKYKFEMGAGNRHNTA